MGRWAANGTYVDNTVDVADFQSSGLVPIEEQARLTPQEKTLNNVTVTAGGSMTFASNPILMDGFNTIAAGGSADISHSWTMFVLASPDGSFTFGDPVINRASTSGTKAAAGTCFFNFAFIQIVNNDAATRTYNVWTRKFNL
ncbi:hypothetical protein AVV20_gp08 [Bacillus phage Palmer]|uniref:Uncharacterized protein n=1 Tax=Bacillus phage Palmer TaxID=1597966 RepID=A0A0C5AN74_9CAUD|nr:hypothetical protein AVV20_gp08 [Bacillus phage Palmer]AJK28075.1 hypothetical protein CPT_Palmer8 [Bacillus phage Palmer]